MPVLVEEKAVAHIVWVDAEEEYDRLVEVAEGVAEHKRKRKQQRRKGQPSLADVYLCSPSSPLVIIDSHPYGNQLLSACKRPFGIDPLNFVAYGL